MSAPQIPDDLLQAQRAFEDADRKVHAYVEETTAVHGKAWPGEENRQLSALRDVRMVALKALWAHPEHDRVLAGGQWSALKKAAVAE